MSVVERRISGVCYYQFCWLALFLMQKWTGVWKSILTNNTALFVVCISIYGLVSICDTYFPAGEQNNFSKVLSYPKTSPSGTRVTHTKISVKDPQVTQEKQSKFFSLLCVFMFIIIISPSSTRRSSCPQFFTFTTKYA